MESIKSIFRIGHGPSSSHTMGPKLAAEQFRLETPEATSYHVSLYGSLAATGKGHFTDKAITDSLSPVLWSLTGFLKSCCHFIPME